MSVKFRNGLFFLSNYSPSLIHGFPTVEHFYVAMKTTDESKRQHIKSINTPNNAKRYGRKLILRPDWMNIRLEVMEYALRKKFTPGAHLASQLLKVGDADLIEVNYWHDNFWGSCTCERCAHEPKLNHLGRLLQKIKAEFLAGQSV